MSLVFGWLPQPIGGMNLVQQPFFDSFFGFVSHDTNDRHLFAGYAHASVGYIPAGRNVLVRKFLATTSEWLLMLDWDISYTPADVYALIDAADPIERPIVSGCYVTYMGEDCLLRPCWMALEDGECVPMNEFTPGEVIPLATCGMGFTLMHRDALLTIEKENSHDPWPWFGHDVINDSRTGEDLTFCKRARDAGLTIWGHGGVLLGHTKARTLHPLDMANTAFARAIRPPDRRLLNIGGGSKSIPLPTEYFGWEHVLLDIEPGPDVDLVMDALDLVHAAELEQQYDAIYSSHSLEHFDPQDVPHLLAGFVHVLRPGGIVDIRVPDGDAIDVLIDKVGLHGVAYESPVGPITPYDMIHGHQASIAAGHVHMAHRQVFTSDTLTQALSAAGFSNIKVTRVGFELQALATK